MSPIQSGKAHLIRDYCNRGDLTTSDPYDIWKTPVGFTVKAAYNRSRFLGALPALALASYDLWVNNRARVGYHCQEYPIVRAQAALALLNVWRAERQEDDLAGARAHVEWLFSNACVGYRGLGWGLMFPYAVDAKFTYDVNTPLSTVTPYVLEAFIELRSSTGEMAYDAAIQKVGNFFLEDLKIMFEEGETMALSYAPLQDRVVFNANAYSMYCLVLARPFLDSSQADRALERARRIWQFIRQGQRSDGSWLYAPTPHSFIDCFHTCFVLKNMLKANEHIPLDGFEEVFRRGYTYLKRNLRDNRTGLYRRFSISNKPSLTRYDLYDNAEMLNLAALCGDRDEYFRLKEHVLQAFVQGGRIYSLIDLIGRRRNVNHLRWAVMPLVHALSQETLLSGDRTWPLSVD